MVHGRSAKSSLSKAVTRYKPRAALSDDEENLPSAPPAPSGRTKKSLAAAVKDRDAHTEKRRKILDGT